MKFSRSGRVVDIHRRRIFPATLFVSDGKIDKIVETASVENSSYILPGFIDAHVHVESSMLIPSEFARLASVHGTVGVVSDPHEIANVLGVSGIRYMVANGKLVPFHFCFGASSCVPATFFETSGAVISAKEIDLLFENDKLKYLSEMMNYPGVLAKDAEIMEKIASARRHRVPVDGHAPELRGEQAKRYVKSGISTDHECVSLEEALEKINLGMHILLREGSAAKNFEALHPLIKLYPDRVMFCTDDKHPHELIRGHINEIVRRAVVDKNYDVFDVLRAASLHPVRHYGLDIGLLRQGDPADFIVVDSLSEFRVLETFVRGEIIAKNGKTFIPSVSASCPNHFATSYKKPEEFQIHKTEPKIHVIAVEDGQLITRNHLMDAKIVQGVQVVDLSRDILKLTVVNRYKEQKPAVAFVKNFGLKEGALASCIAHDSHNIIAVGCNDEDICTAVNYIIENKGGISIANGKEKSTLALPVAGIMSCEDGFTVASQYAKLDRQAKLLGTPLSAPFMTLSFLALLVIPEIKLSDKGLFDSVCFKFI